MTSWCPNCNDQQTDVEWSYDTCVKCGASVGVSSEDNPIIAKSRIKTFWEQKLIREVCASRVPNLDMLS